MTPRSDHRCGALVALFALLIGLVPLLMTASPASAATSVNLIGHGYGHGRGMGQYGALGYAIDKGSTYTQILDYFYGGTSSGTLPDGQQYRVLLDGRSGKETIVYLQTGALGTSLDSALAGGPGPRQAVRIVRAADGKYQLFEGAGCSGPWVDRGSFAATEVAVTPADPNPDTRDKLLQLCEEGGRRYLHGDVIAAGFSTALDATVRQRTLNRLWVEFYLRSVVPSESPSGWGALNGGAGMHALRAQAVAARSYVAAGDTRWSSANTCDSTFCQVYRGNGFDNGSGFLSYEANTSSQAVFDTQNLVRHPNGGAAGAVARTEFSSSTGGYTAGGTFPAVADDGDQTATNPYHTWTAGLSTATIENGFDGKAGTDLGAYKALVVTSRTGLGPDGGRVLTVRGDFTNGSYSMSGDAFRSLFGLRSNWFTPQGEPKYVDAVYQVLLGRAADDSGKAYWVDRLVKGLARLDFTNAIAHSPEWTGVVVDGLYQDVFKRPADAGGRSYWSDQLIHGTRVSTVAANLYGSAEYYSKAGSTSGGFVDALYQSILGRAPDSAGKAYWVDRLDHGFPRPQVVNPLFLSYESNAKRVDALYTKILHRAPDAAGRDYWAKQLTNLDDIVLAAALAASDEFFANATA